MSEAEAGKKAKQFTLPASTGGKISIKEFEGKKVVVLYFYPKDMTSGCTKEACAFRDLKGDFEKAGAVILGVSPDNLDRHGQFTEKHGLNFPLLSDEGALVAREYGVWQEKTMYGKAFMGIVRTTFVIDKAGRIARIWPKVTIENHADEVLQFIKGM